MTIIIDLEGADPVIAQLDALSGRLSDMTPLMRAIGSTVSENTRLRFLDQVDPFGRPWEPLSEFTLAHRRKKGTGAQILRDTGRLMNSITFMASADEAIIGTNATDDGHSYPADHQFGTRRIPQRMIFGISIGDREAIMDLIGHYLGGE